MANVKNTLINALETLYPNKVFLQGTINPEEAYPDEFVTFWTNYTEDNAFFDNNVAKIDWNFDVMFYTTNPANIETAPVAITTALKAAGFIPQGKGNDLPSDSVNHTGWAMEFTYIEKITNT